MCLVLRQSSSCVIWTTLVSVSLSVVSFDWEAQRRLSVLFVFLRSFISARKVQAVVDVVFNQGQPAISEVRK